MIALDALLSLSLLPASALSRLSGQNNLLGGACFSHPAAATAADDLPVLAVDMPLLNGEAALCEVWHSPGPMQSGRQGAIRYRENDSLLFGCLSLAETSPDGRPPLQLSAEAAYQSIFELLEARGFGAVLRFWNYFPAINQESHQIERYRQFNAGRQDAFLAHGRSVIGNVPAACALGTASGGLHVAFLATRADVIGTTEDEWDRVMDVNVKSVYLVCKFAIPAMQAAMQTENRRPFDATIIELVHAYWVHDISGYSDATGYLMGQWCSQV